MGCFYIGLPDIRSGDRLNQMGNTSECTRTRCGETLQGTGEKRALLLLDALRADGEREKRVQKFIIYLDILDVFL